MQIELAAVAVPSCLAHNWHMHEDIALWSVFAAQFDHPSEGGRQSSVYG